VLPPAFQYPFDDIDVGELRLVGAVCGADGEVLNEIRYLNLGRDKNYIAQVMYPSLVTCLCLSDSTSTGVPVLPLLPYWLLVMLVNGVHVHCNQRCVKGNRALPRTILGTLSHEA